MLNTIVQIALGILYGIYLAFLAPTTQRQKAHEWLTQQNVVPTVQEEPTQSQVEALVTEATTQPVVELDMVEDPWSIEPAPIITESQENTAAIALGTSCLQTTFITSGHFNVEQTFQDKSPKKTKPTQNKRFVAKTQANEVGRAALAKMTVAQLRSLCKEHSITWRNAHGSKHLTKIEMLERLTASCFQQAFRAERHA